MNSKTKEDLGNAIFYVKKPIPIRAKQMQEEFTVESLEGTVSGKKDDWLMEGIRGELYICDNDIFQESYEVYIEEI